MNGLSDLELVAQAMEPTHNASQHQDRAAPQTRQSEPSPSTDPASNTTLDPARPSGSPASSRNDTLEALGIDPSSLSATDMAALQPIIDALSLGVEGEDGEDDLSISGILAQMDAAGSVADDLEGKLDALLANLGETEKEMTAALPQTNEKRA